MKPERAKKAHPVLGKNTKGLETSHTSFSLSLFPFFFAASTSIPGIFTNITQHDPPPENPIPKKMGSSMGGGASLIFP